MNDSNIINRITFMKAVTLRFQMLLRLLLIKTVRKFIIKLTAKIITILIT